MSETSPQLALPYIQPAQAQKHVTHNSALQLLDVLVQLRVQAFDAASPPAQPAEGEAYALGADPVGAWSGQADTLAVWLSGAWAFIAPQDGWMAVDLGSGAVQIRRAGAWQPAVGDTRDRLGINAAADGVNRLAVQSAASLFSHDGAGHRMKLNKAAAGETASLLFQSDYSGRAEIGLAGDDDLSFKVSADGTAWTEALRIAPGGQVSGAGVQDGPADAAHGRLMSVGAFGLGATGAVPILADLDAANPAAGSYRCVHGTTLGTPPAALDGYVAIQRYDADFHLQTFVARDGADSGMWLREWRSGAFTPWQRIYRAPDILRPVEQFQGMPTGGIIERGSNANGDYVRFADGTLICTYNADAGSVSSVTELSGFHRSKITKYYFPAVFAAAPSVSLGRTIPGTGGLLADIGCGTGGDSWAVRWMAPTAFSNVGHGSFNLTAIGRWF